MARTLYEMKLARGGKCFECGINIMGPDQLDHTFCNTCWNKLMAHPFEPYGDGNSCDLCDDPKDSQIHKVV